MKSRDDWSCTFPEKKLLTGNAQQNRSTAHNTSSALELVKKHNMWFDLPVCLWLKTRAEQPMVNNIHFLSHIGSFLLSHIKLPGHLSMIKNQYARLDKCHEV